MREALFRPLSPFVSLKITTGRQKQKDKAGRRGAFETGFVCNRAAEQGNYAASQGD